MLRPSGLKDVPVNPTTLSAAVEGGVVKVGVKCCTLHRTDSSSLDVWEYDPGEFEWRVDVEYSACVISGRAAVDLADGRLLSLLPGDALYLPAGMHSRWIVHETLRTVAARGS